MAETQLKLVKSKSVAKVKAAAPGLTPEERDEAARFKALTAAKAARQAMLHRIMSELQELDEIESAA
jgi:hypothetical protein